MSKFVNYNKRTVKLPLGCKDLSDVLKLRHRRKNLGTPIVAQQSSPPHEESFPGTIAEIEKHVVRVFQSNAQSNALTISPSNSETAVGLYRVEGEDIAALVSFLNNSRQVQAMRTFFVGHEIEVPHGPEITGSFDKDLPCNLIYPILPFRFDPPSFAKIVADLFRELHGLNDQAILRFEYSEVIK
jgi:hypothetical protein